VALLGAEVPPAWGSTVQPCCGRKELSPEREATPAACWQDERLMSGYREGVVSLEDGNVACVTELTEVATMANGGGGPGSRRSTACLLYMDGEWIRGSTAFSQR
jgi:hypothetical protein